MSDDRDDQLGHGTQVQRVGALFFWPGRGPSSFRQDEKKMGGAFRRTRPTNRQRSRIHPSASRCSAPPLAGEATEMRIAAAPDWASQ